VENTWKVTTAGPSKIYCDLYRDGPDAESIGTLWLKVVHGDPNSEEEKKAGHLNLINAAIKKRHCRNSMETEGMVTVLTKPSNIL
jgi:hypothetical protein